MDERTDQRLATLEEEMRIQRARSHDVGNKLTEQISHLDDARDDIRDLRVEMNSRFTQLSGQAWRIALFVVGAVTAAASVVSVVLK